MHWVLKSISSPFLDGRQQYSYIDNKERDEAVDIMLSFLSQYDGLYNWLKSEKKSGNCIC